MRNAIDVDPSRISVENVPSFRHLDRNIPYPFSVIMLQRTMSSGPRIKVIPEGHLLMDDKLEIKLSGLPRQGNVALHAAITEGGNVFESCNCYTADGNGEVNLATQPSVAGSYKGTPTILFHWITLNVFVIYCVFMTVGKLVVSDEKL